MPRDERRAGRTEQRNAFERSETFRAAPCYTHGRVRYIDGTEIPTFITDEQNRTHRAFGIYFCRSMTLTRVGVAADNGGEAVRNRLDDANVDD